MNSPLDPALLQRIGHTTGDDISFPCALSSEQPRVSEVLRDTIEGVAAELRAEGRQPHSKKPADRPTDQRGDGDEHPIDFRHPAFATRCSA